MGCDEYLSELSDTSNLDPAMDQKFSRCNINVT